MYSIENWIRLFFAKQSYEKKSHEKYLLDTAYTAEQNIYY